MLDGVGQSSMVEDGLDSRDDRIVRSVTIRSVGHVEGRQSPGSGFTRQPTRDKQMARRPVSIVAMASDVDALLRVLQSKNEGGVGGVVGVNGGGGEGGGRVGGGARRAIWGPRRDVEGRQECGATMYFK